MNAKMSQAWSALLALPEPVQELAADAILDLANDDGSLALTAEQVAEVKRRLVDSEPKFLTLAEVRARFSSRSA